MKILFKVLLLFLFLAVVTTNLQAQDLTLKDRSGVEVNMGIWGGAEASNTIGTGGILAQAGTTAFVGELLYAYGYEEQLAMTLSIGLLSAQASSNINMLGVTEQTSTIMPILLGVRFYVPNPESGARVRPFLSAAIGSFVVMESQSTLLSQGSYIEGNFGGKLGVGVDLFVSDHFKFVADAAYYFMSDFSQPVGGRSNYDGGDLLFGVGYAF
ncbi:MAG: outer membrane beta-barrel protein [Candidatus Kryptoniota bacterium]